MCICAQTVNTRSRHDIKELPLPVGLFSEDVLETSQKQFKSIRLFHDRKTLRIDTNTDIVHWMLIIASDPIIASKRRDHKIGNGNLFL